MRVLFFVLSTIGALSVSTAGVVGYWRFENGALLDDSSGNANSLTNVGGMTGVALPGSGNGSDISNPIPQNGAANGQLAQFTGGVSGFSAADSSSFGQIAAKNTFTLEAYFNAGTISDVSPFDSRYIVSQYNSGAGQRSFSWQINTNEGLSLFLGETGGSFAGSLVSTTGLIQSNKDYYVAVTYNSTTDTGTYYWQNLTDGGPLQSEVVSVGSTFSLHDSTELVQIGYRAGSSKEWNSGALIDEVRISDRVLGENELLVSIPEPSSLMLSVLALAGGFFSVRRRT